ncbi:MAG TPA: CopG family transcriptional regulator [Thermoanaerobaculia bacterium]|jgi:predicted transcriptional regulator
MSQPMTRMTVEVPLEVKQRLEGLARATDQSEARLATEAISSYVDLQEWQVRQIEKGLCEADAGDFASDEEVAAVFARWTNAR